MERTFRAQQRVARDEGARGGARLWLETVSDLLRTAPREHVDQLAQDVSYAARTLRSRPGLTAAAVATLAVGIGSVTAILGIVNGVRVSRGNGVRVSRGQNGVRTESDPSATPIRL